MESPTDRQERVSWWRQDRLNKAHVAVIGAGALGNEVLKNLALMGVGGLHVFDFDLIENSNLSRTVLFGPAVLGKAKAEIAARQAKKLNVNRKSIVRGHHMDVVWKLGGGYLRRMDIVIGCLDNLEARLAIGRHCYQFSIPFIDGGIRDLGGRVQLHLTGRGACMECTVGTGEYKALRSRYSCFDIIKSSYFAGITPTVQVASAFIASLLCQEAIKYLQGKTVPFGHVISWFGETNDFDILQLVRRGDCSTCSVPPRQIRELSVSALDTGYRLLDVAGHSWKFMLPSSFLVRLRCTSCGQSEIILKPSHDCKDTDIFCAACNSAELITLDKIDVLDSSCNAEILSMQLLQLGIPPLATFYGVDGEEVTLCELTRDADIVTSNRREV